MIDVVDHLEKKVNELQIPKNLQTVEDTQIGPITEDKIKIYLLTQSILPVSDINVRVLALSSVEGDFMREDDFWVRFSASGMPAETAAGFAKTIAGRSKADGIVPGSLVVDYEDTAAHESYRISVDKAHWDDQDYGKLVKKMKGSR